MSEPNDANPVRVKFDIKDIFKKHEYLFHVTLVMVGGFLGYGSVQELFETPEYQATWSVLAGGTGGALVGVTVLFWLKNKFLVSGTDACIAEELGELRKQVTGTLPRISDLQNQVLDKLDLLRTKDELGRFYTDEAEYYSRYYYLVNHAQRSVDLVGDGFSCHDEPNRNKAKNLANAIRSTLKRNVLVRRFQYHNTLSINWLEMLIHLKEEFGDNFRVYMNSNLDPRALPYVMVITDAGENSGSVNIMFTMDADTSLEQKTAGPAFIFESCQKLSRNVRRAANEYFKDADSCSAADLRKLCRQVQKGRTEILREYFKSTNPSGIGATDVLNIGKNLKIQDIDLIRAEIVRDFSKRKQLYFAYGSNLSLNRVRRRSQTAEYVAIAELPQHELVFNMRGNAGEGKGGGIANVVPNSQASVWGTIYFMEHQDLDSLKEIEEDMGYETKSINVYTKEFGTLEVLFFICCSQAKFFIAPNSKYADFITTGLEEHEFPDQYRNKITRLIMTGKDS